ncbi:MAG TPA: hypothetical protein VHL59_17305 [Thermoanaerobaculia bacterium]|nr:hypothetical protein [Thermoanaerobaculia bacterium]
MVVFAASFIAGAIAIFGAAALGGAALRAAGVSLTWRMAIGAALFAALAVVDLRAIRTGAYCPIGWRRQTPQRGTRFGALVSAAVWGFDTGIVVTTFRVAAITWGALSLTLLGLAPWWIGIGYGLGFTVPIVFLLLTRDANSDSLQRLLRMRSLLQSCSAIALVLSCVVILA